MQMWASFVKALELVIWIERSLHDLSLPPSDRIKISAACFATALEHHHAVVILLRERLNGSAFALVRSEYEAFVRGVRLAKCATDEQLNSFLSGGEPPRLGTILCAIEAIPRFDSKMLSAVKAENWKSMCAYTHTGALQVQRWIASDAIDSRHSPEEIEEVLEFTNAIALLAACGVATLEESESLEAQLWEKSREIARE